MDTGTDLGIIPLGPPFADIVNTLSQRGGPSCRRAGENSLGLVQLQPCDSAQLNRLWPSCDCPSQTQMASDELFTLMRIRQSTPKVEC